MNEDWRKDFDIVWHGEVPDGVEAVVREDMLKSLTRLKEPFDLVTHTVFLSDDMDGPCVSVWGGVFDDVFCAEYLEKAEWVTLGELDENQE